MNSVFNTSLLLSLAFFCLCSALIIPADPFNAREDAKILRQAIIESNEEAITALLTRRSGEQRVAIAKAYNKTNSRNLVADFYSELSGDYMDLMVAMVTPLAEYYDKELVADVKDLKNRFYPSDAALDILITSSNADLKALKRAHRRLELTEYNIPYFLYQSWSVNNHGLSINMIAGAINGKRNETQEVDVDAAIADATLIYNTKDPKDSITRSYDEQVAIEKMFVTRSYKQLRQIFEEYTKLSGHDIDWAFKKRGYKTDLLTGILNMIPAIMSIPNYYATRLNTIMSGMGTRDSALIRIVIGRSEIDLDDIKQAFQKKYGHSLASAIGDDTSGNYRRALLAIVDPVGPFNAKEDAKILRQAVTEHNEEAITALLTRRSDKERVAIDEAYVKAYTRHLDAEFFSLLSGDYKDLMVAMVTPLSEYYAKQFFRDDESSVEILTTSSNAVLKELNGAYKRVRLWGKNKNLAAKLQHSDLGISDLMISCALKGVRNETQLVDVDAAIADATLIYNNCERTPGDLRTFSQTRTIENIFIYRSYKQLRQICEEYTKLYGHGIEKAFEGRGFKSDVKDGILKFIDIVKSIPKYYAKRLYDSIHGPGTNDRDLIRIVVGRSDIDMDEIKEAFQKMYGISLASAIEDDTSGDYGIALLAIVGSSGWSDTIYTNPSPINFKKDVPNFFSVELNHVSYLN